MRFATGDRLGPYEILAPLGAGGMGEVYRARDPRLGREVAVKILPAAFASDPEHLARFEQEARAAAALNHPNILAVYDVGRHQDSPYIVAELLEGQTLRARLQGSPGGWAQRKALPHALAVARGLAAAHEKGILHRDLKPENIFLTNDGRTKILDFGLAKLAHGSMAAGNTPTLALDTRPGVILGTAGYMSPEQVRGEDADHRSDIFAFGTTLYEMLSGRPPFRRQGVPETLAAILHEEVDSLSDAHPGISPGVARVVDRCLEKQPDARFQSTQDLAFALEALSTAADSGARPAPPPGRGSYLRRALVAGAAIIAALAVWALALPYLRADPPRPPSVRFQVTPPGAVSYTATASFVEISPDGTHIAMAAATSTGTVMIWIRPIESLAFEPLAGTERGTQPFWSFDGRSLAFFADGKLKTVPISGGAVLNVASVPQQPTGGTWRRDGTILFSTIRGPLMRVAATGGTPVPATTLDASRGEHAHMYPMFLPDGVRFLYYALHANPSDNAIFLSTLDDQGSRRLVVSGGSRFSYLPEGYLLYARDGVVVAHPFDLEAGTVAGEPLATRERVDLYAETGNATFSLSRNGVLAYRNSIESAKSQLLWLGRDGSQLGAIGGPANYRNPRLSPDGKRIVVEVVDTSGNPDLVIIDVARGISTRFTFDSGRDASPVWIDGGRRIAWRGPDRVLAKPASGAGEIEVLHPQPWIPDDVAPDGSALLLHPGQPRQVWMLPLSGPDRKLRPIIDGQSITTHARVSPDGKWVAYASNDSGRFEVWIQAFPTGSGKWLVSSDGGLQPKWGPDGRELFYIAQSGHMMAVPVAFGAGVEPGRPVALFATSAETTTGSFWHEYDVTPDGKRFLINSRSTGAPAPMTVVVGWGQTLKE